MSLTLESISQMFNLKCIGIKNSLKYLSFKFRIAFHQNYMYLRNILSCVSLVLDVRLYYVICVYIIITF